MKIYKNIKFILFSIFSFLILNLNVYAYGYSGAPQQVFISKDSELSKIFLDSDKTCLNFLKSIDFDIFGKSGLTYNNGYTINFSGDYVSGNSFEFIYNNVSSAPTLSYQWTTSSVNLNVSHYSAPIKYRMSCANGDVTQIEVLSKNQYEKQAIIWPASKGTQFAPALFQSSYSSYGYDTSTIKGDYQFVGVGDLDGNLFMSSYEFTGKETLDNNLLFGNGVPPQAFRNYLAEHGDDEVPLTDDYASIYVSGDSGTMNFFTLITEDYENYDTTIYIRPITNDYENFLQQMNEALLKPTFNFCFFYDYENSGECTHYTMYYDTPMLDNNYFFPLDTSSYIYSSKGGFSLLNTRYFGENKTFLVRYNKNVWSADFITQKSLASGGTITANTINGQYTIANDSLNTANNTLHSKTDNVIDNGVHNSSSSSSGFINGLLDGIVGIKDFISSVMGGINTLIDSISALVTSGFSILNSLPIEIRSVLYLAFLCTIIAIVLKIFL